MVKVSAEGLLDPRVEVFFRGFETPEDEKSYNEASQDSEEHDDIPDEHGNGVALGSFADNRLASGYEGGMLTTPKRPKLPGLSQGGSIRLFKNPVLEALTHVHPLVPLVTWGPVVVYLIYLSYGAQLLTSQITALVLAGLFTWTLMEYLLHRFVFHFHPRGAFQERIEYLIHGIHHDQPEDATRLVMPPAAAVILAVILFSLFRFVLGPSWVLPFFSGFLIGYLCYDYIHYAIHHFQMSSAMGKFLKSHHMKHHFMTHGARWGVSSPLWDIVFRTMKERRRPSHVA